MCTVNKVEPRLSDVIIRNIAANRVHMYVYSYDNNNYINKYNIL